MCETWPRSTRLSIGPSWKAGAGVIRLPSWNGIISTSVSIVYHPRHELGRSWASAPMSIRETSLYRALHPRYRDDRWPMLHEFLERCIGWSTRNIFFFLEILRYGMKRRKGGDGIDFFYWYEGFFDFINGSKFSKLNLNWFKAKWLSLMKLLFRDKDRELIL